MKRNAKEPSPEDEVIGFSRTHELSVRSPGYLLHLVAQLEALFTDGGDLKRLVGFTIADLLAAMRAVELKASDRMSDAMGEAMARARPRAREVLRGKADAELQSMIPLDYRRRMSKQLMRQVGALPLIHEERAKALAQAEELVTVTPAWLHQESGVDEETCRRILERFALPFGQKQIADNLMSRYEPLELRPLIPFANERYMPILMHLALWCARESRTGACRRHGHLESVRP